MQPLLESHFGPRAAGGLRCLHLGAPDDDESSALRERGHRSISVPSEEAAHAQGRWSKWTVIASGERLPFAPESFDFIFTNAFGVFARDAGEGRQYARQLGGLVRPGGALLVSIGNRLSPVDLCRSPGAKASLRDLELAFGESWNQIRWLSAEGYFGWSKIPAPLRPLLALLKPYLRWVSGTNRRWLYGGPLNSFFILWVVR